MSPRRNRSSTIRPLALALGSLLSLSVGGCASSGANFRTSSELGDGPRRPDGVAIDPESKPPEPRRIGDAGAGVLTLTTPLGADAAISTVEDLLRHVVQENVEGVADLFTEGALAITSLSQQGRNLPNATLWWNRRFERLDYGLLRGETLYRTADLEIFRGTDLLTGSPRAPQPSEGVEESDVIVRVFVITPRVGQFRLMGDEIVLFLRRTGNRYKIYRMVEEFQVQ